MTAAVVFLERYCGVGSGGINDADADPSFPTENPAAKPCQFSLTEIDHFSFALRGSSAPRFGPVRLAWPEPKRISHGLEGVILCDHFSNVVTNIPVNQVRPKRASFIATDLGPFALIVPPSRPAPPGRYRLR